MSKINKFIVLGLVIIILFGFIIFILYIPSGGNYINTNVDKVSENTAKVTVSNVSESLIENLNLYSDKRGDDEPDLILEIRNGNNVERHVLEDVVAGDSIRVSFENNDRMELYSYEGRIKRNLMSIDNIDGEYYKY